MEVLDNVADKTNNDIILLIIVLVIAVICLVPLIRYWIDSSIKKFILKAQSKKEESKAEQSTYKLYTERESRILDVIEKSAESNILLAKSVEGLNIRLEQSSTYDIKLDTKMDCVINKLNTFDSVINKLDSMDLFLKELSSEISKINNTDIRR